MPVKFGLAIAQIAVTSPVVIKTTRTQPGTSPRSSLINVAKRSLISTPLRIAIISAFSRISEVFSLINLT